MCPRCAVSYRGQGMSARAKRLLLAGVLLVAGGLAAALIAVSVAGGDDDSTVVGVHGAEATAALLEGIPQQANVLGRTNAPLTIVEYGDLQCPACQAWTLDTFPAIVAEYVRTGKARIVFDGVAFLGPDSATALQAAFSAGEQNKLWHVVDLLYHNQGAENSGWVTDDLLQAIGDSVPGFDSSEMLDGRDSAEVAAALAEAQGEAQEAGVALGPTPSFDIGRTGGPTTQRQGAVSAAELRQILDSLLES